MVINYKSIYSDFSVWSLLLSNLILIYMFILGKISPLQIIIIYVFQSVIIIFFKYIKFLTLPELVYDLPINAEYKTSWKGSYIIRNICIATVFLLSYATVLATLSLFYIFIIYTFIGNSVFNSLNFGTLSIAFAILILFFNHLFSFFYNRKTDMEIVKKTSIYKMLYRPLLRIMPIHLWSMLAFALFQSGFLFCLIVKTILDIILHILEHENYYLFEH